MAENEKQSGEPSDPRDSSAFEWLGLPLVPAAAGAAACGLGALAAARLGLDSKLAAILSLTAMVAAILGACALIIMIYRSTAAYGAPWGYFMTVFAATSLRDSTVWPLLLIVGLPFAAIVWMEKRHVAAVVVGMLVPPLILGGLILSSSAFAEFVAAGVLVGLAAFLLVAARLKARKS